MVRQTDLSDNNCEIVSQSNFIIILNIQTQGCKDLRERVHWFQRDEQTRANHKRGERRTVRGSSERVGHRQDGR